MTHEEAIDHIKDMHSHMLFSEDREALETLIPELRESKEERIRTRLSEYFRGFLEGNEHCYENGGYVKWEGLDVKSILDWLEKQKEEADKRLERVELHCKEVQEFDKKIKALRKEWYGEEQKEQDECPEYCVRSHCIGCSIYEKQKEQKPIDVDYISGIREELLGIENNARNIDGLTESQWVAIRAAHRLLGEYIEKEQEPVFNEDDERLMELAIHSCEMCGNPFTASWLKSLRPQPHWKPTEEHLSALLAIFNDPNNIGSQTCQLALTDLYEQLKKL